MEEKVRDCLKVGVTKIAPFLTSPSQETLPPLTKLVLVAQVMSDSETPWSVAQSTEEPAPLSMGFSSKNTGVGCHFLLPGDLPDPGIEPGSPALQADSLPPRAGCMALGLNPQFHCSQARVTLGKRLKLPVPQFLP